jgi:NAD-dependent dihydropyrimidine dehydrogenase PreA subunit
MEKKIDEWHGISRKEIEWYPNVDESKCIGCGICVTSCGRKVYDFDKEKNKSVVARPLQCMVGCTTCQVLCLQDAISFPDKDYVRNLIKKEGLIAKAKKELMSDIKIK